MVPGYIKLLKDRIVVPLGQQFEFGVDVVVEISYYCNCCLSSKIQAPTSIWSMLIIKDPCKKYIHKKRNST